jgi:hypothetical protein
MGSYSDYNVKAIFATEADANRYAAAYKARWDEPFVETFEFYPEGGGPALYTWYEERAKVMDDCSVEGHEFHVWNSDDDYEAKEPAAGWISNYSWRLNAEYGSRHPRSLEVAAQGGDEQAVHKVYGERLFFAQEAIKNGTVGLEYSWGSSRQEAKSE